MSRDWVHGEVLKVVFPFLDGKDLAFCMIVCRQWRDIARDDYLWKCICAKRWPSIIKRPPAVINYNKLFVSFSRLHPPQPLLPSRLSFEMLDFYIDIWSDNSLIFSESVPGPALLKGIKSPPVGIPDALKALTEGSNHKLILEVEHKFSFSLGRDIMVSVLIARNDTNQIACLLHNSIFDYIDGHAYRALAYDYLNFSPKYPFISGIRAWVSLFFRANNTESIIDVFGIEIDFGDAATLENEILWLLDMLDWK